jgi:Spy/CpxP family protein refolding chaperone
VRQPTEKIMKKLAMAVSMVAMGLAASVSMADPGGGYGYGAGCGAGMGPGGANCGAPGGGGYGHGPGYHGRGGGGQGMGMSLLTPEERTKFHDAMHEMKSVGECTAVVQQRQALISERAKEKGLAAPPGPPADMCERMKARGFIS